MAAQNVIQSHNTVIGCSTSIDLCRGINCNNHGICELNATKNEGFYCKCAPGFSGKNCEKSKIY